MGPQIIIFFVIDMKRTAGRPARKEVASKVNIQIRTTQDERIDWQEKARQAGYKTLSDMIRHLMQTA